MIKIIDEPHECVICTRFATNNYRGKWYCNECYDILKQNEL